MRRTTLTRPDAAIQRETLLRISFIGVFFGGIIDSVVTTIFFVIMVVLWLAATPDALKYGSYQAIAHFKTQLQDDTLVRTVTFGLGALGSVIGGYYAARFSRSALVLNGGLSAWACIGFALYLFNAYPELLTQTQLLPGVIGGILCGAIGGYLRAWLIRD